MVYNLQLLILNNTYLLDNNPAADYSKLILEKVQKAQLCIEKALELISIENEDNISKKVNSYNPLYDDSMNTPPAKAGGVFING